MSFETIKDIVDFNPSRPLSKGKEFPFIDMASLPVNGRDINEVSNKVFNGGGAKFKNGDTLFARITPCLENGKTAKVENLPVGCIAHGSTEFIVLSAKSKDDEDFVYYLARLPDFRSYAISRMEGTSGRQRVSWQALAEFNLRLPEKGKRKKIGKILKSLDDKIHLNNQINQTLESIAQAIFKSWFIDFEPVRAKIAAKQTGQDPELAAMCAISGKTQAELDQLTKEDFAELQATAALFPDELVESELGTVPKGWELQQIKDIAKYCTNKISLKDLTLENYISTENMLPEKKGIEKASSLPKANSVPAFRQGNILVSNIRPYFKKIWFSFFDGGHSNDVLNFEILEKETEEYLYNLIYQDSFFDQMMASSKGSKMPRGDKKAIMDFQIIVPPISLRCLYSAKVRSFYFYQNKLKIENQTLIDLRDTLLPRLLSGEVDVSGLQGEGVV